MDETFGAQLRRLRLAAAFTQESLAERAGLSPAAIAALESGRRTAPRLTTVARLSDALELPSSVRAALAQAAQPEAARSEPEAGARAAPQPADPSDQLGTARNELVGRARELRALLDAVAAGTRLVAITGEPGIGKTRLTAQVARELQDDHRATLLWGHCSPEPLGVYEPFVGALRSALGRLPHKMMAAIPGVAEIGRLLPELTTTAALPPPTRADATVERRLLFDAVLGVLRTTVPAVLVVDDVHWADASTLSLLAFLAAEPSLAPFTIIVTMRSTTGGPEVAIAELTRRVDHLAISLDGLDVDATSSLITNLLGADARPAFVTAIHETTDGNPFFVEELVEHLATQQALSSDTTENDEAAPDLRASGVPARLRDTLEGRFAALSADARTLLPAGAVLGRSFDPFAAGRMVGFEGDRLASAVDETLLSQLVDETESSGLTFHHELIRTAVLDRLSSVRRVQFHRAAATDLEAVTPLTIATISDIARHWSEVARVDPSAMREAAHWTVRAGDAAFAAAATDEAVSRYEHAIGMWSATTREHADALVRLGSALASAGRVAEADERFRAAVNLADALDDADLRARAALGFAGPLRYGEIETDRIAGLERALAPLPPDDHVFRPALMAMLMRQLAFDRSEAATARRAELAAGVRAEARRADGSDDLLLALAARDSIPLDDPGELLELGRRVVAIAERDRILPSLANGWYQQAWAALELGDGPVWHAARRNYDEVAEAMQLPYELSESATMQAANALLEGRYGDAEAFGVLAIDHGNRAGNPNAEVVVLGQSVTAALDRGQAGDVLAVMVGLLDDAPAIATFVSGLTLTAALAGDHDLARSLLEKAAATGFDKIRHDAEWLAVVGFYAHACAIVGDAGFAGPLHATLATTPARGVRVGPLTGWWGAVDHHLGALAAVLGHDDEAVDRFERALPVEQSMGAAPWEARTRIALAAALHRRDGGASAARARALLAEAAATAERLGAAGIQAEAAAAAVALDATP